jgi:diaminopimelate epimerase
MTIKFRKMHGLGNDFVIFDNRFKRADSAKKGITRIANRRLGVGCDQVIFMESAKGEGDIFLDMYNADGSALEACGNGTRCVAHLLMQETGGEECLIETVAGLLHCSQFEDGIIQADMGAPRLEWSDIPLSEDRDTLNLGIGDGDTLENPVAVNMGNPHCVFFVNDVEKMDIETLGPSVERNSLFPQRTNVEFAQILSPDKIRMRVWERGTGVTMACGSGACATIVAAVRRGLTGRRVEIVLDGGSLYLEWRESDGHVLMSGPVTDVFKGIMDD